MVDHTTKQKFDLSTDFNLLNSMLNRDPASDAWPRFIRKYKALLVRWSLRWGASVEESEDVVQETLLNIHTSLSNYEKIPRSKFRAWMKTIAFRCWLEIYRNRSILESKDETYPGHNAFFLNLSSIEARNNLVSLFDQMADQEILEIACNSLRSRVEDHSWQCFELTYFQQIPGEQVAAQLNMTLTAVYLANSRLRKMLRQEIERIDSIEIEPCLESTEHGSNL